MPSRGRAAPSRFVIHAKFYGAVLLCAALAYGAIRLLVLLFGALI